MYTRIKFHNALALTISDGEYDKLSEDHKTFYRKAEEDEENANVKQQPADPATEGSDAKAFENSAPYAEGSQDPQPTSDTDRTQEQEPEQTVSDFGTFGGGTGGGAGASSSYGDRQSDSDSDRNTSNDSDRSSNVETSSRDEASDSTPASSGGTSNDND